MADSMNVTAVAPELQHSAAAGTKANQAADAAATAKAAESGQAAIEQAKMSVEEIQSTVEKLNEFMSQGQRSLSFSVDDSLDEVVVRVTDKETDELIRQIPSEEVIKFKQHLDAMLGMLFNEKA